MDLTVKSPSSPWPHRWAWALACATFPLVWWGGLVTATGSGMAFKDWLTADGIFTPVYPLFAATGDKFIEDGHRKLGMIAGLATIALVIACFRGEPRRWVRRFSWALLAGVVLQGVLGGMRVVMDERLLALVHGCVGPLFFAATAAMVAVTARSWIGGPAGQEPEKRNGTLRLAVLTAALAYVQLVVGAFVRHSPLMLTERAADMFQAAVYFHVVLAIVVTVQIVRLAIKCRRSAAMARLAAGLAALVLVQLALGASTWVVKYGLPTWAQRFGEWNVANVEAGAARAAIITTHGAVGALIVALCVVVALKASRNEATVLPRVALSGKPLLGAIR
jgi:cytochrome c oxidase assembly protein subunit 15